MRYFFDMRLKHDSFKIEVYSDSEKKYRLFTDSLKYSDNLEVVFDKKFQFYTIKDLSNLRSNWRRTHPDELIKNVYFENFAKKVI